MLASQIGCGNKVLVTPVDRAQFNPEFNYTIKTTQNTELKDIPGSNIQNLPDRLHITQNNETKYLLHNQVCLIDGESFQRSGSYILEGMGVGGLLGVTFGLVYTGYASSHGDFYDDYDPIDYPLMGALFGFLGFLGGSAIGLMIPKTTKVQITPTVIPSTQNVGGGVNVGAGF